MVKPPTQRARPLEVILILIGFLVFTYLIASKNSILSSSSKHRAEIQTEEQLIRNGNHLLNEHSAYLQEHAHNPVDWYPWGKEAFELARQEHKPILLSIGFSSCHWCHVMEKESFEDLETARIVNRDFVNIKVDREERPDVDQFYIRAVAALRIRPAWPLTVFLTPELSAFAGGTYFPLHARNNLPAFKDELRAIREIWTTDRTEVNEVARSNRTLLFGSLLERHSHQIPSPASARQIVSHGLESLLRDFDTEYGGFGDGHKYPLVSRLNLFMRAARSKSLDTAGGDNACKKVALITLASIADGGIHDQVGGGFHRYSVDRQWYVPHFEKCLSDNALLASAFASAYKLSGRLYFADIACDAANYYMTELRTPEGAFYAGEDADSAGQEGAYYLYKTSDIQGLSDADSHWLADVLNITSKGNYSNGLCVAHLSAAPEVLANQRDLSYEQFRQRLHDLSSVLLKRRASRVRPKMDENIICSWNALAISGLVDAYDAVKKQEYLNSAKECARFILTRMRIKHSGELRHTLYHGALSQQGFLEDYAFSCKALLDLAELDPDPTWTKEAREIADLMLQKYWNDPSAFFFYTTQKDLPAPTLDNTDEPVPASAAIAIEDLLRLEQLTGEKRYGAIARQALDKLLTQMNMFPQAFSSMLSALEFSQSPDDHRIAAPAPKQASALSEDEAIDLVENLPEIQNWMKDLEKAKDTGAGNAGFMVLKSKGVWTIKVFESFADRDVTYGFYDLDLASRKVHKVDS